MKKNEKCADGHGKLNPLVRFLRWLNPLTSKCPHCGVGQVGFYGDDWTGSVWISVYRCDCCHKEFI